MKTRRIIAVTVIGGACGLLAGSDTAQAIHIGGHAAIISSSVEDCTDMAYASIKNNCGSTNTYTIPLAVDGTGNKALSFRGQGATSSNDVECRGQAMNNAHTGFWATAWTSLPAFGSVQDVSMGTLHVGGDGAAYMRCRLDDGGQLLTVEWEQ